MSELAMLSVIRVCDTETTGFSRDDELVEIGWTDLRLFPSGWAIEGENNAFFVNPGRPISKGASEANRITDEMVSDGISPSKARYLLSKGADVLVAHNAPFDRRFVRSSLPWICTMKCAREVWPKAVYPQLTDHKQETLREFLGIDGSAIPGDPHRAGYDSSVCALIFLELLKLMPLSKMLGISEPAFIPLTMPFGKFAGSRFTSLPDWYLKFLVGLTDSDEGVVQAAKDEVARRKALKRDSRERHSKPAPSAGSAWDRSF